MPPEMADSLNAELFNLECQEQEQLYRTNSGNMIMPDDSELQTGAQLWTDKWTPKSYIDLISEEGLNREVVSWLREWDALVFKKEKCNKATPPPTIKGIVLCGPPGSGKSTLAHIIAKHAGYTPVEVNASMVRNCEDFKRALTDALEYKNVFSDAAGSKYRPNLLILDEIDGMNMGARDGKGAVEVLCKVLKQQPGAQSDDGAEASKSRRNGRALKGAIAAANRPIICTCNDYYAKALRPLRNENLLRVFTMHEPRENRLLSRLQAVCHAEGLKYDTRALIALCRKAEFDIRTCLNSLQFLKAKAGGVTAQAIESTSVGLKDVDRNIFETWGVIFHSHNTSLPNSPPVTKEEIWNGLYNTVATSQTWEKLSEGCWQNYPAVISSATGDRLKRAIYALDWLAYSDVLQRRVLSTQSSELTRFLPLTLLAFHEYCAVPQSGAKLAFPSVPFKMRQAHKNSESVLHSFLENPALRLPRLASRRAFVLEVISPLLSILSAQWRTVSKSLLSEQELATVRRLVELHAGWGVTYRRSAAAAAVNRLDPLAMEPPIDELVMFDSLERSLQGLHSDHPQVLHSRLTLTQHQKQFIMQEVRGLQIRHRAEAPTFPVATGAPVSAVPKPVAITPAAKLHQHPAPITVAKPQPAAARTMRDFFKAAPAPALCSAQLQRQQHAEQVAAVVAQQAEAEQQHRARYTAEGVQYRYNEGFTNAVRRRAYFHDFV
eukprot:TRINITY_DN5837_c0_g1_i1.p1 TRINITY_DN5837_c0_g1~~TRINITY_DN5837_c0_g1_i1.p1  ORF type:complete len:813 (-),score=192.52 TRINITY_DN5837_c0_g1_i1:87-2243(-)